MQYINQTKDKFELGALSPNAAQIKISSQFSIVDITKILTFQHPTNSWNA
jgi:hypothetical protein